MRCHSTVLMHERATLLQKIVINLMKRKACFYTKGVCGGPVMANKMFILHCHICTHTLQISSDSTFVEQLARGHYRQVQRCIYTPLDRVAGESVLLTHQVFVYYIYNGLRWGFQIGFDHSSPLKSATSNMVSAHHASPRGGYYIPRKGTISGSDAGPFQLRRCHTSSTHDLLWCHPCVDSQVQ